MRSKWCCCCRQTRHKQAVRRSVSWMRHWWGVTPLLLIQRQAELLKEMSWFASSLHSTFTQAQGGDIISSYLSKSQSEGVWSFPSCFQRQLDDSVEEEHRISYWRMEMLQLMKPTDSLIRDALWKSVARLAVDSVHAKARNAIAKWWCGFWSPAGSSKLWMHNIAQLMSCDHGSNNRFESKGSWCQTLIAFHIGSQVRAAEHNSSDELISLYSWVMLCPLMFCHGFPKEIDPMMRAAWLWYHVKP